MTIQIRLHDQEGKPFSLMAWLDLIEVTTAGDTLPTYVPRGQGRFTVTVESFGNALALVHALNPSIQDDELRKAIREQTIAIGQRLLA